MNFVIAKAGMSEQALNTALAGAEAGGLSGSRQEKRNERRYSGVPIIRPGRRMRTIFTPMDLRLPPSDLDGAVKSLADILPDMLRLSETEKACQLMAAEIEKTRRRVNALEHVIIPEARKNIKYITMKLDENERSTQIRLMKVKDMMLEEKHHYKEKRELCS